MVYVVANMYRYLETIETIFWHLLKWSFNISLYFKLFFKCVYACSQTNASSVDLIILRENERSR